jgi:CheY-like chemotaxis protein
MGAEILSQQGYEVLGVTDGQEVLESLNRFAPDLVLADVAMPGLSGYDICRRIKADPSRRHVRVLLLAGAVDPLDPAQAAEAGADGVLQKPFEPSAVIQTIAGLMRSAPPGDGREGFEQAVQAVLDDQPIQREQVRAAVVLAVESALPRLLDELTEHVLQALRQTGR